MQSLIFFEKLQISLDLCTYCLCDSKKRVANGKLFMYLKKPNKRLYKTANSKHLRSSDLLWLVSTLIVTGARCTDTQFRCGDGGCISLSLLCDFVAHCVDSSDESSCGKTVFVAQWLTISSQLTLIRL